MADLQFPPESTVSVLSLVTVKPKREQEYEASLRALEQQTLGETPGQLGVYVLRPPAGSKSREYGIIRRFATEADRDAFYQSPQFVQWQTAVAPMVEGDLRYRALTGLEAWVTLPGQHTIVPPPRWKTTVLTWMGAYPIGIFNAIIIEPYVHHLHIAIKGLILGGVTILMLSMLVMPLLTRVFWHWLYPPVAASAADVQSP